MLISAISFGAQFVISSILSPKPRPEVKGKLTGEVTATDSIWGAPVTEVYGGRPADGIGGVEVGTNVFWLPRIEEIRTTTQQPTGGGGKGGRRSTTTVQYDYKCDIAAAVGRGHLRLLRLKLNEDTVYNITGTGTNPVPQATVYEAEDGDLTGSASIVTDTDFSGGEGVSGLNSGTLALDLAGGASEHYIITIAYKSVSDVSCQILIGGEAATYIFTASSDVIGFRTILKALPNVTNPMIFQALSTVQGLRGRYYTGQNFDSLTLERIDPNVNFDYGLGAPALGMPADDFSIRWEGFVTPQFTETYTFSVEHDDGARLWVNGTLIIDQWTTLGTHTGTIALTASTPVSIKLEFYDAVNVSKIKLSWNSTSLGGLQIIPASALAPPTDTELKIDAVYVEPVVISGPENPEFPTATGILDEAFPAEAAQDNFLIPDPKVPDANPFERYNSVKSPDTDGLLEITLPNNAQLTWYEGTETQPVDPVIAAQLDAQFGAGSTPAFRGIAYFRIQGLYISKYGGNVPQFRAVVENIEKQTVEEICIFKALEAGLLESDLDYSAGAGKHVRGIFMNGTAGADKLFEQLAGIYNLSFVETHDGLHTIKDLSDRTVKATITRQDLGAYVADEQERPPIDDVTSVIKDSSEMICRQELQFLNPLAPSDYDTDRVSHTFPYTSSVRTETKSVNAVLLPDEARAVNARDLQMHHLKKLAPANFNLPHKYSWLDAGDVVSVEIGDEFKKVRIEEKTGAAPGVYEISATSQEIYVLADENPVTAEDKPFNNAVVFPCNTVGTIIDIPALADAQEGRPGVYAACCRKGILGAWQGAGLYREKAEEYGLIMKFERESVLGKAVNALAILPEALSEDEDGNFFDTESELLVDFYGDFEPTSVTNIQATDGANSFVVGSEVCVIRDWTRDNNYPNRWQGKNLYRILKFTAGKAASHVAGERVVFLDDSVKFITLDREEVGVTRNWKFVTNGQRLEDAAVIDYQWAGDNLYNRLIHTNTGATGASSHNLPAAAEGLEYGFEVVEAFNYFIQAQSLDIIRIGSESSAAGGSLRSSTPGAFIYLKVINGKWTMTEMASDWEIL